ncbi:MAG: AbrB/MazE/SpoVT family DNA-binding domain-containing protein [Bifidobacteriaceae bacterium]|jgi:antitoxin VapB|nr:AbrB/MazE/SpoVT family DNA-binding domain-containing protein [Bifidobacteriaceae bacterium]
MAAIAKLFMTGRSQAVRLPKDFRFPGKEVLIRRDPATGGAVLTALPASWPELFALADSLPVPEDFLAGRRDLPAEIREPL